MKPHVNRKGQGLAIDCLFAALIFLLLLNSIIGLWQSNMAFLESENRASDLRQEAEQTLDLLVRHSGSPEDWEKKEWEEIEVIGLAKRDRVLDQEKVERFSTLAGSFWDSDYNSIRSSLMAGRDFHFTLRLKEGGPANASTAEPPSDLQGNWWAASVKRVVKYGGDTAIANLTLYAPKT